MEHFCLKLYKVTEQTVWVLYKDTFIQCTDFISELSCHLLTRPDPANKFMQQNTGGGGGFRLTAVLHVLKV